jgi:hypothetical protein
MGIKLDWHVESEQTQARATDDPDARRHRRDARRRLLLIIAGLVGALALLGAIVLWRLRHVDNLLRQDLIDTAQIEITALRLGDFANYMALRRSASDAFMLEQSREFENYQRLKEARRLDLTGQIVSVEIDQQRGRVVVQEKIDGVPYNVAWFYWHYEDDGDQNGWRRVPADLTFWGEPREIITGVARISYFALDEPLAQALAARVDEWWTRGCAILICPAAPPTLEVEIVAEHPANAVEWTGDWTLRVHSPLVDRARADAPLAPDLEREIARQIGVRLVGYVSGGVSPLPASDAAWLRDELARWLGDALIYGGAATPGFTATLAKHWPDAPRALLNMLGSAATLDDFMIAVTGAPMSLVPIEQLSALNWQSFFQWRLDLEARLLAQPDASGAFLALYDQTSVDAASSAAIRLESPQYAALPVPQVTTVTVGRDANSQTLAWVQATRPDTGAGVEDTTIIWRVVGGTWKRTN